LIDFDVNQIDIGLPYRPKGVSDAVFVTRPLDNSRIKSVKIIILEEEQDHVDVGIKNIPKDRFIHRFKRNYLKPALRTNTGIKKIAISEEVDYILTERSEKFWEALRSYGLELPDPFPWKKHITHNLIKNDSYLVIPRKIRLNSPNTFVISIYSDKKLGGVGPSLWYLKASREDAKILDVYFNSILGVLQIFLFKSETLGGRIF